MGSIFPVEARYVPILMIGLENSGKTTILHWLKSNQAVSTSKTVDPNAEKISLKEVKMSIWDIGGPNHNRHLWNHYLTKSQGLIYVIDSSDHARLHESISEFHDFIYKYMLSHMPMLILCNKQDLPNTASPIHLNRKINLGRDLYNLKIGSCCGLTGEGLHEGLSWIYNQIPNR